MNDTCKHGIRRADYRTWDAWRAAERAVRSLGSFVTKDTRRRLERRAAELYQVTHKCWACTSEVNAGA